MTLSSLDLESLTADANADAELITGRSLSQPEETPMNLEHQRQRISLCRRHPAVSPSPGGLCAPCLHERLEGFDPSTRQEIPSYSAPRLESFRSCRSYSTARKEINPTEQSRRSCSARCRDSLFDLFYRDDGRRTSRGVHLTDSREQVEDEILVTRERVFCEDTAVDQGFHGFEDEGELKTMKELIDLEMHGKKQKKKDILWVAASAFTHKLRKLSRRDKIKSQGRSIGDVIETVEDFNARKVRETQSEVGEYGGLGRRSCDTDPRLSLDAGRFSLDGARWSFDKPRDSLDGYFHYPHHQNQTFNSMVSFLEDVKVIDSILRNRGAMVEEKLNDVEEERNPGVSAQTHDLTAQRRRSLDCSSSVRRGGLLEIDELKSMLNAKVSPATTELFYGAKLLTEEGRSIDSNTKHSNHESLNSIESEPKVVSGSIGEADLIKRIKKLQKWRKIWNIWGIKQRRGERKCLDSVKFDSGDLNSGQALPDAWQRLKLSSNGGLARNNSNSGKLAGSIHGSGAVEAKAIGTRLKEESVLQRNPSARYSPSHLDNGLLRFYLTPLRSYRSKSVKSRLNTVSKVVM